MSLVKMRASFIQYYYSWL